MLNKIKDLIAKLKTKKSDNTDSDSTNTSFSIPKLEKNGFIFKMKNKIKSKLGKNSGDGQSQIYTKAKALTNNQFSLQTLTQDFFAAKNRTAIHSYSLKALFFFLLIFMGKILSLSLQPNQDYSKLPRFSSLGIDTSSELAKPVIIGVKNANLFKTKTAPKMKNKKKETVAQTKCEKSDGRSALPITLINTTVMQDSVKSLAAVQVRSNRIVEQLREGQKIKNLAKIEKITRLELIVKNLKNNRCESIASSKKDDSKLPFEVLPKKQAKVFKKKLKKIDGISNDGNKFTVKKNFLNDKLKNLSSLLTEAKGLKIDNPDGSIAFKIVDVVPSGIFAYLGIQNGDVIQEINGNPINSVNEIMSLFGKLKNFSKLNLTINRNGASQNLDYQFK